MEELCPHSEYYLTRYHVRLALGNPKLWGPSVLASDEGGSPVEHKWRIHFQNDGTISFSSAASPGHYIGHNGEPEDSDLSYSGIILSPRPFKWQIRPISAPNVYLIVLPDNATSSGEEPYLVLSDLPQKVPRTALVPLALTDYQIREQAWSIKKVPPPPPGQAEQRSQFCTCPFPEFHDADCPMVLLWDY